MFCKKFYPLLLAGISFFTGVHAQNLTTPEINSSMIPPSPDAASLGKFGVIPVNLYTGMPNVSVPIYDLKSNKLSVSISLAYNNNGYRPGEDASWAGLGWTVQAGGVITRVVKDKVDDGTYYSVHWQQYPNLLDMIGNMDYMQQVVNKQADTEPDIYIFNFNGHSGKFILVGSRAYLFPHQDLKIVQIVNGFTITAEDGVCYYFQDSELTTPNTHQNPGNPQDPYISAWNLTKIVSTDNTDEIDFHYTPISELQSNASYQESYQQRRDASCNGSNSGCDVYTVNPYAGAHMDAKRLTSITCPGGYIDFIPEATIRQDLNSTNAYALKDIAIFQPNNKIIKKISLVHSYFSTNAQLKLSAINFTGYYVNSILGSGGTDSIYIPNYYTFQYNNETGNFAKGTRAIDNWGYYNGKNNTSLFDHSITPSYTPACPVADRSVDATSAASGTLAKMTFPTGGYTNFIYEGNLIGTGGNHQKTQNQAAGTTVYTNGNDSVFQIIPFNVDHRQVANITDGRDISNYQSGGVLNVIFILRISKLNPVTSAYDLIYTSHRLNKSVSVQSDTLTLDSGAYQCRITCESTSLSVYAQISYTSILNVPYNGDPGPGVRIKSIQSYDGLNTNGPALTKNYFYSPGILLTGNGYGYSHVLHYYTAPGYNCGGGTYSEILISSQYSSSLATLISDQMYYSSVTEVNHDTAGAGKTVYQYAGDGLDALNVWMLSQSDYKFQNGGYILLKQKSNTYAQKDFIDFWAFSSSIGSIIDPSACVPLGISTDPLDTMTRSTILSTSPYALSSMYNYLTATDEITYDQAGANPMTIHTDYYYDNPQHLQPTRTIVQNSKGYPITTQVKYPLDYNYSSCTSLYTVDTTFKSARDQAHMNYELSAQARYNVLYPLWNPAIYPNTGNDSLMANWRRFSPKCETVAQNSYAVAINSMNLGTTNYYSCLLNAVGLPTPQSAITLLQNHNVISVPIEQIVSINKNGTDYLFGANKTDYGFNYSYTSVTPVTLFQTGFASTSTLKSDFIANPTNYYQPRIYFKYDPKENIIQQSKVNDINMSYIWDYNKLYPIAQVSNADSVNIAYTSFEADGTGNWTISSGGGGASSQVSVIVNSPNTSNIFTTQIPTATTDNDYLGGATPIQGVEDGVKFSSSASGSITGIRFYKTTGNSGTHIGELYSSSGTRLAQATFTGESGSGWQTVTFSTPVPITAGTSYVAAYFSSLGYYVEDNDYFLGNSVSNSPLTAPADGTNGLAGTDPGTGQGFYLYTATPAFPNQIYRSANYWVDVIYSNGSTPVANAGNNQSITLPASTFTLNGTGSMGTISSYLWTQVSGPNSSIITTPSSSTTTITGFVAGTYIFQLSINGGISVSQVSIVVNSNSTPVNIFTTQTTTAVTGNDFLGGGTSIQGIETGVRFSSSIPGTITGIRFYKTAGNSGTHIGELYSSTGTRLAQATFTSETATGWQTVTFSSPVSISAGTSYIAAYFSSAGYYVSDANYFLGHAIVNSPLTAPADGTNGGTGTDPGNAQAFYLYTATPALPNQIYFSSNYWVDVIFVNSSSSIVPNAGNNQTITLPASSVTLDGSGSSGTITSYLWSKVSGPNNSTIVSPTSVTTSVTGLTQGTYVFKLSVIGGGGGNPPTGVTGVKSYNLNTGTISKSGLTPGKIYVISYWSYGSANSISGGNYATTTGKTINGWTYYEHIITMTSNAVTITGGNYIDELRLYPSDAQMTTYTYDPLVGITNTCSPTNQITNYFYDPLARLKFIKDTDGNIIKTIDYHFQIQ